MIYFSNFDAAATFSASNVSIASKSSGGGTSVNCTLPTAASVGDALYVIATGSFAPNNVAGYSDLNNEAGAFWNGRLMKKVLASGDISAGSVTVTYAGDHAAWVCLIAMNGDPTLRNQSVHRIGSGGTTSSQTTTGTAPVAGDFVLHFASARGNIALITANHGTALVSTSTYNGEGAGRIFSETASGGHFSTTWTYDNTASAAYVGSLCFVP